MTDTDFGELYKRRQSRLLEFLRLRRQQLGLSIKDMEVLIKRRRCKRFDRIEGGQDYLWPQEYPYVEQALQLPPSFIIDLLTIVNSSYGDATAAEVLSQLDTLTQKLEVNVSSVTGINTCNFCERQVRWLLNYHSLSIAQNRVSDKSCVCGGTQRSDSDVMFRDVAHGFENQIADYIGRKRRHRSGM